MLIKNTVLAIDAGNTFIKVGRFQEDTLVEVHRFSKNNMDEFFSFLNDNKSSKSVISSVLIDCAMPWQLFLC